DSLRDLESNQATLMTLAMRAARIARLLNEVDYESIFKFEVGGYPKTLGGMSSDTWRLAETAKRLYITQNTKTNAAEQRACTEPIEVLESSLATARAQLATMESGDPYQRFAKIGLPQEVKILAAQLAARRALLFEYLVSRY